MRASFYSIDVVAHDRWHQREKSLIENPLDTAPLLQEHLTSLSASLCKNLYPALALERHFGEQNDKTMYIAPFIRSVLHTAATGIDIQHVSYYPLAVDPCFTEDPHLKPFLDSVQAPFYGHATGIICASIPFPISCQMANDDQDDSGSDQGNNEDESSIDFGQWIQGDCESTYLEQTTPGRSAVIDHSFLARLTVSVAEDRTPLGLFCMAQAQGLHDAMIACLFQRLSWGIREPLMGIALDRTTTVVRILLGWLDDSVESDCFVAHIAQDASGCYDLSDASDAFKFASIIATVGRRFSTICKTAVNFTDQLKVNISERRLKNWRMDQTESIVPEQGPSFISKVDAWLADVAPPDLGTLNENIKDKHIQSSSSSSITMAPKNRNTTPDSNHPPVSGPKRTTRITRTQPSQDIKPSDIGPVPDRPPSSTSSESGIPTGSSHLLAPNASPSPSDKSVSASKLAAGEYEKDKTLPTGRWLLTRMSITRTLPFYPMLQSKDMSVNLDPLYREISNQYYEHVGFSWLSTPLADADLRKLTVFKEADGLAQFLQSVPLPSFAPYKPLSGESEKILHGNLALLESVFQDVKNLKLEGAQACENECRHSIDLLVMKFFHGRVDGTANEISDYSTPHTMVSLERLLRLPRGYLADASSSLVRTTDHFSFLSRIADPLQSYLRNDQEIVKTFSDSLDDTNDDFLSNTFFKEDVYATADVAVRALGFGPDKLDIVNDTEKMSKSHMAEPDKAKCDSIGYIRIPGVFSAMTASKSFNLICPPTKSAAVGEKYASLPSTYGTTAKEKGTLQIRAARMVRLLQPENPHDLFANSQSLSITVRTIMRYKRSKKAEEIAPIDSQTDVEPTDPEMDAGQITFDPQGTHSVASLVQTGGADFKDALRLQHDLFLPIVVAEHKRYLTAYEVTSVNQGRIYATAAVKFYAAMGIYGVGVYTIISEGPVIIVTVSYGEEWKEFPTMKSAVDAPQTHELPKPSRVHIIERNNYSFDLSDPWDIVNFATFLIKLRIDYVPKVLKKIEEAGFGGSIAKKRNYLKGQGVLTVGPPAQYKTPWRKYKPDAPEKPDPSKKSGKAKADAGP